MQKPNIIDKKEKDDGLIVDNDFGDDFDDDEEEEEEVDKPVKATPKKDIFEQKEAPQGDPAEEEEVDEEQQEKLVQFEFQKIYDTDPQLRQVIGADANSLTIEEKYQILTAYMNGGGVQGLLYDQNNA